MGNMKPFFLKRISVFLLCTLLLSSTVFMSYGNTLIVKAVDETDLLRDAVNIALSAAGIYVVAQSGGSLAPLIIPYISTLAGSAFDVHDYITDNGDGTTTISEDFVQLVLQAYGQYKDENVEMFDGTMQPGTDGYYHFDSVTVSNYWEPMSDLNYTAVITDINTIYPCAILVYSNRPNKVHGSNGRINRAYYVFYIESEDRFYTVYSLDSGSVENGEEVYLTDFGQALQQSLFLGTPHYIRKFTDSGKTDSGDTFGLLVSSSGALPKTASIQVSSSSIPVYHNLLSLKEGLRTGDFSAAYNYGKVSGCESSKYTGSYAGGDITVTNEKLEGVLDKLTEIDETGKNIDDKLKDLLDWLGIGDGNGDIIGGSGSWYDKVLLYLDKILKQLKSIKRWTIIDTVIDGVDAIADWIDLIHDILSDVDNGMESAVATLSSALDDATGLLKNKFPFSVPWDILFLVTLLAAEPETPYFEIPINFDVSSLDMHIHYDFVLDFTPYQYLSDISRVLLSMTYAAGLFKMTSGVVNNNFSESQ